MAVQCARTGVLLASMHVSCHRDDEPEGECSIEDNQGCDDGMVCRNSADGAPACFCSSEQQTGCGDGLVCYEIDDGDPTCLCSVDAQTGCDDEALACELVPGQGAGCFPPVTMQGMVFDLASSV